jgi:glycosyltransferase involved in cell wall biosynthesis
MKNNIVSIGYGRHIFKSGDSEQNRLIASASEVGRLDMVIFSKRSHGLVKTVVTKHLTLHPTNSRHPLFYLIDAFLLARKLVKASEQPVTVTTQDPFETAIVGLLIKNIYHCQLVVQEHGDFFGSPFWRKESLLNRLRYVWGLYALKKAQRVRVVSQRTKQHLLEKGIKNSIILPVAVDPLPFLEATPDPIVENTFQSGTFVFLSVARFVPQKNLPLLLKSFSSAYTKNQNIRLLLVGSGREEVRIQKQIKTFPVAVQSAIHILPWSVNVAGLMKASSAYVLSSNYEGWGRVLIEALLTQIPIVTTAVGCADEVIKNEYHGLVVPVGDVKAMTAALIRMSSDGELYRQVKENLVGGVEVSLAGTDIVQYKEQWAHVFGGE